MAIDMKEMIADAAWKLLVEKKVSKLTVKDIVEECQITRQAFYYHFEDIPDLFQWMLNRGTEKMMQEFRTQDSFEDRLRCFFLVAINAAPFVKKTMQSNYGEELKRLHIKHIYEIFERTIEEANLYKNCSRSDLQLIIRYHSRAVMGILQEWTDNDTKNLDHIVHQIYLLITGGISPIS